MKLALSLLVVSFGVGCHTASSTCTTSCDGAIPSTGDASADGATATGEGDAGGDLASPPATSSQLTALTVSTGALSPAFAPSVLAYKGATGLAPDVPFTVTPTAEDSTAQITVNGATVASGSASAAITLLAVGAVDESSKATGINGDQSDTSAAQPVRSTCSSTTVRTGRSKPT